MSSEITPARLEELLAAATPGPYDLNYIFAVTCFCAAVIAAYKLAKSWQALISFADWSGARAEHLAQCAFDNVVFWLVVLLGCAASLALTVAVIIGWP